MAIPGQVKTLVTLQKMLKVAKKMLLAVIFQA